MLTGKERRPWNKGSGRFWWAKRRQGKFSAERKVHIYIYVLINVIYIHNNYISSYFFRAGFVVLQIVSSQRPPWQICRQHYRGMWEGELVLVVWKPSNNFFWNSENQWILITFTRDVIRVKKNPMSSRSLKRVLLFQRKIKIHFPTRFSGKLSWHRINTSQFLLCFV